MLKSQQGFLAMTFLAVGATFLSYVEVGPLHNSTKQQYLLMEQTSIIAARPAEQWAASSKLMMVDKDRVSSALM